MSGLGIGAGAYEGGVEADRLKLAKAKLASDNKHHREAMKYSREQDLQKQKNLESAMAEKQAERESADRRWYSERDRLQENADRDFGLKQHQADIAEKRQAKNDAWEDRIRQQQFEKNEALFQKMRQDDELFRKQVSEQERFADVGRSSLARTIKNAPNGYVAPTVLENWNKTFHGTVEKTAYDEAADLILWWNKGEDAPEVMTPGEFSQRMERDFNEVDPYTSAYANGGTSNRSKSRSTGIPVGTGDAFSVKEARENLSVLQKWLDNARSRNIMTKGNMPENPELDARIKRVESQADRLLDMIGSYGMEPVGGDEAKGGTPSGGPSSSGSAAIDMFRQRTSGAKQEAAPATSQAVLSGGMKQVRTTANDVPPKQAQQPAQTASSKEPMMSFSEVEKKRSELSGRAKKARGIVEAYKKHGNAIPAQYEKEYQDASREYEEFESKHPGLGRIEDKRESLQDELWELSKKRLVRQKRGLSIPDDLEKAYQTKRGELGEFESQHTEDDTKARLHEYEVAIHDIAGLRQGYINSGKPVPKDIENEYQIIRKAYNDNRYSHMRKDETPEDRRDADDMREQLKNLNRERRLLKKHGRDTSDLDKIIETLTIAIGTRNKRRTPTGSGRKIGY